MLQSLLCDDVLFNSRGRQDNDHQADDDDDNPASRISGSKKNPSHSLSSPPTQRDEKMSIKFCPERRRRREGGNKIRQKRGSSPLRPRSSQKHHCRHVSPLPTDTRYKRRKKKCMMLMLRAGWMAGRVIIVRTKVEANNLTRTSFWPNQRTRERERERESGAVFFLVWHGSYAGWLGPQGGN